MMVAAAKAGVFGTTTSSRLRRKLWWKFGAIVVLAAVLPLYLLVWLHATTTTTMMMMIPSIPNDLVVPREDFFMYHGNRKHQRNHNNNLSSSSLRKKQQESLQSTTICSSSSSDNSTTTTSKDNFIECCLLDNDCLIQTAQQIARPWKPFQQPPSLSGNNVSSSSLCPFVLWLIKVPKSASSTMAGLVLRIAHRRACPGVLWEHGSLQEQEQQHNRNRSLSSTTSDETKVLLVSPIRNPQHRALSDVYFHRVSLQQQQQQSLLLAPQRRKQPSDAFIIKGLNQIQSNYITEYTRSSSSIQHNNNNEPSLPLPPPNNNNNAVDNHHHHPVTIVTQIMERYNFLFLVEDLDTSMVVFAWLFQMSTTTDSNRFTWWNDDDHHQQQHFLGDFVVTSSKTPNSWYSQKKRCVKLIPPITTEGLHHYFQSKSWKQKHAIDRLLHATVQECLKQTIQLMEQQQQQQQIQQQQGPYCHRQFCTMHEAVDRYRRLRKELDHQCASEIVRPCSPTGQLQLDLSRQSCYARDFGCGYRCYDRILSSLSLTQSAEEQHASSS